MSSKGGIFFIKKYFIYSTIRIICIFVADFFCKFSFYDN